VRQGFHLREREGKNFLTAGERDGNFILAGYYAGSPKYAVVFPGTQKGRKKKVLRKNSGGGSKGGK